MEGKGEETKSISNKKYDAPIGKEPGLTDFDLDTLVDWSFNYSFEPLKKALAYLLKAQKQGGGSTQPKEVEDKFKDYDKIINDFKADRKKLLSLESKVKKHERRITELEGSQANKLVSSKDIVGDLTDKLIEIEFEIKQLIERLAELQSKIAALEKQKQNYSNKGNDSDEENEETKQIEEIRKQHENELRGLKGRMSQLEDKLKMMIMKIQNRINDLESDDKDSENRNESLSNIEENNKTKMLNNDLNSIKRDIESLEEKLKKMKRSRQIPVSQEGGIDYMVFIEELQDSIQRLEDSQSKTEFRSQNNESRCEKLEADMKDHDSKIINILKDYRVQKYNIEDIEQKLKDLKEVVEHKVDIDEFNEQINYIRDLFKKSSSGHSKNIEITMPPPSSTGLGTKETRRLSQISDRIPDLEKSLKLVIERLDSTEGLLENHKSLISELQKQLSKKANITDLSDTKGLESTVNDTLIKLKQLNVLKSEIDKSNHHINEQGKTIKTLEGRIDFMNNTTNERLRDMEGLLVSLKDELDKLDSESNRQGGLIIKITQRIDTIEIKIDNIDKLISGDMLGAGPIGRSDLGADTNDLK